MSNQSPSENKPREKGDSLKITLVGRTLQGVIGFASDDGRSLVVLFDEGVPPPFGTHGDKQCLLLYQRDDGSWVEERGERLCEIG